MFSNTQFQSIMNSMGFKVNPPLINYNRYLRYERLWNSYIKHIVIPAIKNSTTTNIRLLICESAPGPFNGTCNYIFSNLNKLIVPRRDRYLDQIYKGINCTNKSHNLTKKQALINLACDKSGPVIILDILPTHGIKLNSTIRGTIAANYLKFCDILKIINLIITILNTRNNLSFNVVFAIPPTLFTSGLGQFINQHGNKAIQGINIKWIWPYQNINVGQGHAPSWRALCENVRCGF